MASSVNDRFFVRLKDALRHCRWSRAGCDEEAIVYTAEGGLEELRLVQRRVGTGTHFCLAVPFAVAVGHLPTTRELFIVSRLSVSLIRHFDNRFEEVI